MKHDEATAQPAPLGQVERGVGRPEPERAGGGAHPDYPCRHDGRCQYAIDSGAEGLGHCPRGKCVMPEGAPL